MSGRVLDVQYGLFGRLPVLRTIIGQEHELPPSLLRFVFRDAEMVDDLSLWDQGVRDGDVLSLVISGPSDANTRPVKVMKDVRPWQPGLFLAGWSALEVLAFGSMTPQIVGRFSNCGCACGATCCTCDMWHMAHGEHLLVGL